MKRLNLRVLRIERGQREGRRIWLDSRDVVPGMVGVIAEFGVLGALTEEARNELAYLARSPGPSNVRRMKELTASGKAMIVHAGAKVMVLEVFASIVCRVLLLADGYEVWMPICAVSDLRALTKEDCE
jgi:hypothetical protein